MTATAYYAVVILLGVLNVALAGVAYAQRAKQIRGNRLREQQVRLAETRNELAESRLGRLDEQIGLMGEIRDSLAVRGVTGRGAVVGVIDVGSATMRLTVARRAEGEWGRIGGDRAFLRLGAEIERAGEYSEEVLVRVSEVARGFVEAAEGLGCERLAIVVTAPGRSGANPEALLERITVATGRMPCLLSASQEAKLTFVGAATGMLGGGEAGVVCDVGGGSTEISTGSLTGGVEVVGSFDVGAVRLAEKIFRHDPPTTQELEAARAYARRHLVLHPDPAPRVALVTGGSAHTMAKLGASVLEPATLHEVMARVTTQPSRKAKGMHRHRLRALPAGIVLFERIHEILGIPLTVAAGGLRRGVLCELDADRFHQVHAVAVGETSTAPTVVAPASPAMMWTPA